MIGLCLVAAACGNDGKAGRAQAATRVDSAVSRETELARFRDGLAEPAVLAGGAASRDALVRAFVRALESRDTSALAALLLTRAEFAYLYYPTHPEAQPPYSLSPGLMWFMLEGRSRRGLTQALEQRSEQPLRYAGYSCAASLRQGENNVWAGCTVRRQQAGAAGGVIDELLFGPIIERGGRFKFVSYANKL